jgi:hypothetical protein
MYWASDGLFRASSSGVNGRMIGGCLLQEDASRRACSAAQIDDPLGPREIREPDEIPARLVVHRELAGEPRVELRGPCVVPGRVHAT